MGATCRSLAVLVAALLPGCESVPAWSTPSGPDHAVTRSQKPDSPAPALKQTTLEASSNFPSVLDSKITVQVRASVNGVAILDEEVRDACYPALVGTLSLPEPDRSIQQAEIFRRQLQDIIDREVLLQDAFARLSKNGNQYLDKLKAAAGKEFDKVVRQLKVRAGTKSDEALKDFLRAHGQSLDGMRRQVERNFMAREYIRSRIYPAVERVGHQQILEYYLQHAGEFRQLDSVKWQDVFVDAGKFARREDARRFAESLAARARAGEDFGKLAQYDNGDSSYRNGEGCGQRHGEIRPAEAEPVLFQLRDGMVGPVIELPTGFHVVRLVKREYAGQLPLDEKTQAEIRRRLQGEVAERESKRFLAELKEKASIEIASTDP